MINNPKYTNALIHSQSPYLKQHAHNPVNWHPWSEDIWKQALEQHKPVIVSIGYSACHWCHVMERECFEDEVTAAIMNEQYISIKVDREERPDIDMIYMDSCQLMTGRGGWPLNVICMPDKTPVYAGTYFPKESWQSLLQQIGDLWRNDQAKMNDYAKRITDGILKMNLLDYPETSITTKKDLHETSQRMVQAFDLEHGGLDRSQKFPMPSVYEYLLDAYLISGNKHLLDFVNFTLIKMANGGIFDHLRGGFYRYATDKLWFAPHFEKMLYDNAQLISLYSRAYAITDADLYKNIALQTLDFVESELRSPEGAYYAALDADSDGIEGRYYVFTNAELSVLDAEERSLAEIVFGLTESGNWEHGYNILHKPFSPLQILEKSGLDVHHFQRLYSSILATLRVLQEQRNRPGLDNKIICSWNGLMLKALADAGKYLKEPAFSHRAAALATWMLQNLKSNGKLWRTYSKTDHRIEAFSEDYACVIQGLLALFESDGNVQWLLEAGDLCDMLVRDFYDGEKQLFTFTPQNQSAIITHKTDISDDVIPASNSILSMALQKIGMLLDRNDLLQIGKSMPAALRSQAAQNPAWYSNWCRVAQMEAVGLVQVVNTNKNAEYSPEMSRHLPAWAVVATGKSANLPLLKHKKIEAENRYFVCVDQSCFEPVSEEHQALQILADLFLH